MAWNAQRSLERINKFKSQFVSAEVIVEDFASQYRPRILNEQEKFSRPKSEPVISDLPYGRAVLTDGVHIYANLMNFNSSYAGQNSESEANQRRAMQFLHLHYGACDQLVSALEIQRVDYHSARLHAVVLSPTHDERERVQKALAFANAFVELVNRSNEMYGGRYSTDVRIGIDSGKAVAINSGRRGEPDPIFIGSPANKAAHLAQGDEPGVFLSPNARIALVGPVYGDTPIFKMDALSNRMVEDALQNIRTTAGVQVSKAVRDAVEGYVAELEARGVRPENSPAVFNFHEHTPPLKTIDFVQHPPSNAIRMPVASIYADIDGYTKYIDKAIATNSVGQAVQNLHVIRGEFSAALRDDFGGRKIRFIGDCIHGLLASGSANNINAEKTIKDAIKAAGGLRSSFDLCKMNLPGISELGLAIGIEYGTSPICRIGLRGDASVRCASSAAIIKSEELQCDCDGNETAIGPTAFSEGGVDVRHVFKDGTCPNLDYASATTLLDGMPAPSVKGVSSPPLQAHAGKGLA